MTTKEKKTGQNMPETVNLDDEGQEKGPKRDRDRKMLTDLARL